MATSSQVRAKIEGMKLKCRVSLREILLRPFDIFAYLAKAGVENLL